MSTTPTPERPPDLPSLADMEAKGAALDATTAALQKAVRMQAGLLQAARVVIALAGAAAKTSGVPLGSTVADIAMAAVSLAEKET